MKIALVIPAYNPSGALVDVVRGVAEIAGDLFSRVIVVDDGSTGEYAEPFRTVADRHHGSIVRRPVNGGKGAAIKSGFARALEDPELQGVVMADADAQHRPDDVVRVGRALAETDAVVLGVRRFTAAVPLRSRFGNVLTRTLVNACVPRPFGDTQCGLRGLPRRFAELALRIEGERYEYDLAMLLSIPSFERIVQVPIATIYEEGNRSSHFRPLVDSWRIYSVLARHAVRGSRPSGSAAL